MLKGRLICPSRWRRSCPFQWQPDGKQDPNVPPPPRSLHGCSRSRGQRHQRRHLVFQAASRRPERRERDVPIHRRHNHRRRWMMKL